MRILTACAALAMVVAVSPANAKGCLKGALIGGAAGHMAGHHGVLGAAAGCIVGRHEEIKKRVLSQRPTVAVETCATTAETVFERGPNDGA